MSNYSENEVREVVKKYLDEKPVLQLATSVNDKPYSVSLHYYSDSEMNIYFASGDASRHSIELLENPQVCAGILVFEGSETEQWVAAISIEGKCAVATPEEIETIVDGYCAKLGKDRSLIDKTLDGNIPVSMHKVTPTKITLYDSKNFPDTPRMVLELN